MSSDVSALMYFPVSPRATTRLVRQAQASDVSFSACACSDDDVTFTASSISSEYRESDKKESLNKSIVQRFVWFVAVEQQSSDLANAYSTYDVSRFLFECFWALSLQHV